MSTVRFSARSLRAEVRSTDGDDYGIDFSSPIDAHISDAEAVISDPNAALGNFNTFRVGSRNVVSYGEYSTVLALRVLASYLRRRYGLRAETRETISRGLIQALGDSSTMRVVRRDISSFYESVPTNLVKEQLLYKDVLPPRARRMLEAFFSNHCPNDVGLPRGLGLSAILSEYVMKPVDATIRLLPGVYRYHRFVDDIIVLSTDPSRHIANDLAGVLPEPLRLNRSRSKQDDVTLARPSGGSNESVSFNYLGYRYTAILDHAPKKPRKIVVGISKNKIDRIKTKLLISAKAYTLNSDASLFIDRVRYLSGNYRFVKRRPIASTGRSVVKSGLFYNYRYCGTYQGVERSSNAMKELRELDWFFQNSVIGNRYPLGREVLLLIAPAQLARLRNISFAQGHLKAFNCAFSSQQVADIKEAWRNV